MNHVKIFKGQPRRCALCDLFSMDVGLFSMDVGLFSMDVGLFSMDVGLFSMDVGLFRAHGQSCRCALWKLIPKWYKTFSLDHFGWVEMKKPTRLGSKTSTA